MKFDSRLIHQPKKQPRLHRTAWGFVTLGFWMMYLYMLAPLVTLVLWLLGIRTAMFELYSRDHQVEPFLLVSLPIMAGLCAVMLISWAEYNRFRFGGMDRRSRQSDVTVHEMAAALGASDKVARALKQAKVTVLHMDDQAHPIDMTLLPLPKAA
ncbi:poly-beta-1,6-N-acetyl-D-glucosamine biosynthesis protein PgaD [Pseudoxanthomonas putridarboris]|uniref:Poly-beta-1,6-N-acetyl-D-glucosamine biosynthesis protein PgaD n=1 Tax=Pseudoxanthomonas putridarboris TaxID=752605 RepID=A0ABU9J0J3_9GAMM